ncbi:MAG: hypothetical protein RBT69_00695 [Spirochaetia bacterium]|jgi:hypothetical protein|nr:hypothetical protein [Spirochaetia bacterium]
MPLELNVITPVMKRARGYRFYSQNGKRFLDFYQEGGKSVLGATPAGFSAALKKEIDKGNYYSTCSLFDKKILKGLKELTGLSSFNAGLFCTADDAVKFISANEEQVFRLSSEFLSADFPDPELSGNLIFLWYPFCGITLKDFLARHRYVIPLLPFPGAISPVVLLSSKADLAGNNTVPPLLLAGLNIIIYRLIQHIEKDPYKTWENFIGKIDKIWDVSPPYLFPRYDRGKQEFVYKTFLENRILIQPAFSGISTLPAEISDGERALFLKTADKVIRGIY